MITLKVDSVNSKIIGLEDLSKIDIISDALSYMVPSYKYSFNFRNGGWDGKERLLSKKLIFPTGLLDKVCDVLKSFGLEYEIVDTIKYPDREESLNWVGPELFDYQKDIVSRALDCKRGMIKSCTGSGKTIVISKIVSEYNFPTMIYVVSLDLLGQMKDTLENCLGVEVGIIGDGKCVIKNINVCSVWTAGVVCGESSKKIELEEDTRRDRWDPNLEQKRSILEVIKNAKLVILDEAQFAAANSIRMILRNSVSASYKFGCTATPWRSNGDDILLEAAFGPRICDISATQLIREGYLVPPKIIFRDVPQYVGRLKKNWETIKHSYIVNNHVRNNILVGNTLKLLEMGRRPLMLFRDLQHGKALVNLLPPSVKVASVTGNIKTSERDAIRKDFISGKIDLLCASTVYDQGIDIKELDALVLCSGGKSTAKALQRIGRVIRSNKSGNKKDAIIVDTFDQAAFVKQHSIIRYETYKTEDAFIVKTESCMSNAIGA